MSGIHTKDGMVVKDRADAVPAEARADIEAALSTFRQWLLECEHARDELIEANVDSEAVRVDTSLFGLISQWTEVRQEMQRKAEAEQHARKEIDQALASLQSGADQAINKLQSGADQTLNSLKSVADQALNTVQSSADQAIDKLQSGAQEVQQTVSHGVQETVQGSVKELLSPLVKDRDRLRESMRSRLQNAQYNWLELLLDLRETLDDTAQAARSAGADLGWRKIFVPSGLTTGLTDHFDTALHRVDGALESRDVKRIDCIGKPVDPQFMRVVETVAHDELPDGHVCEIVRQGYVCGEEVIRFAEVKAVKS